MSHIITVATLKKPNMKPIGGFHINKRSKIYELYEFDSDYGCNLEMICTALKSFSYMTFNNKPLTVLVETDVLIKTIHNAFNKSADELKEWCDENPDRIYMLEIINTIRMLRADCELSQIYFEKYDRSKQNVIALRGEINKRFAKNENQYDDFNNGSTDVSF